MTSDGSWHSKGRKDNRFSVLTILFVSLLYDAVIRSSEVSAISDNLYYVIDDAMADVVLMLPVPHLPDDDVRGPGLVVGDPGSAPRRRPSTLLDSVLDSVTIPARHALLPHFVDFNGDLLEYHQRYPSMLGTLKIARTVL